MMPVGAMAWRRRGRAARRWRRRRGPRRQGQERRHQGRERRDADDRDAGREPDGARGRDADPQAREGAGADRDGDAVEGREAARRRATPRARASAAAPRHGREPRIIDSCARRSSVVVRSRCRRRMRRAPCRWRGCANSLPVVPQARGTQAPGEASELRQKRPLRQSGAAFVEKFGRTCCGFASENPDAWALRPPRLRGPRAGSGGAGSGCRASASRWRTGSPSRSRACSGRPRRP